MLISSALHRDENKLYAYAGKAAKSTIDIYSCAGKLIRSINVRRSLPDAVLPLYFR